jgi:sodium transport system permease protein
VLPESGQGAGIMNFARIKFLYRKELLEILRNWGLIILLVFFPLVVYPTTLIFLAELGASQQQKLESRKTKLLIKGDSAPELMRLLRDNNDFEISLAGDGPRDRALENYKAILFIPEDFEKSQKKGETTFLRIRYDSTDDESKLARMRLEEALLDYKKELLLRRLDDQHLPATFVEPIALKFENIASQSKIFAEHIGQVLPLILIAFIMLGTIQVAVDVTAGEKERKTIQTLLLSPLSRLDILTAKLLVVLSTTFVTTALNFISVGFTVYFAYNITEKAQQISISPASIALSLLLSIPLVVLISALFLLMGIIAKNQLEANIYVLPVLFLGLLPAGLPSIPGIRFDSWMSLVPIANTALTVKAIFLGTCSTATFAITFFSNAFYAVLIMLFVSKVFQKEDFAFGGLSDVLFVKPDRSLPSPGEALVFFLFTLAIYFFIGNQLQQKHIKAGLIISQLVLLLGPSLFFIIHGKYNIRKVLKLENPGWRSFVAAPLIGWSCIILSQFYEHFQSAYIRTPHQIEEFMQKLITFTTPNEAFLVFLTIAITPAIIEEIAFRGVILSGIQKSLSRPLVCLIVGFLFSVFHLNLYILVPVTFLGAIITYAVIRSKSIYTGMVIHFFINGTQIVLANHLIRGDFLMSPIAGVVAIAVLIGALALLPDNKTAQGG